MNVDRAVLGYDEIKEAAEALGCRMCDLIVLARDGDPFLSDAPGRRTDRAAWFAQIWKNLRVPHGVHLRRLHYLLVSTPGITLPSGEPYENSLSCWKSLSLAASDARYLDLVPARAFVDRRAGEPLIYHPGDDVLPDANVSFAEPWIPRVESAVRLTDRRFPYLPSIHLEPPLIGDPYSIEVWVEKSTMNDVLVPLAERLRFSLITGVGDLSITSCWGLVERVAEHRRKTRIFYISDFDPGGDQMPVAAARKIEFFVRREFPDLDIRLCPLILTAAQVAKYRLPRVPIKETDARREHFEARHGEGAVELDALEALHPGELRRIVEAAVMRFRDQTLEQRIQRKTREVHAYIEAIKQRVRAAHADAIAKLEADWNAALAQIDECQVAITEQELIIDALIEEWRATAEPVWRAFARDLEREAADINDIEWPEPEPAREDDDPLFDSRRDYLEQISRFKRHQGKAP